MGSAGTQTQIAKLLKQQPQFVSAYIDTVTISYVVDDITGLPDEYIGYGCLYSVTNYNAAPSTDNLVVARSSDGVAGTVHLPVKRTIRDDSYDSNSGFGALAVFCELPDITATADITMRFIIEVTGRWHAVDSA